MIGEYDPFDTCTVFITAVTCVYRFPPCDPTTGRLLPICHQQCPDIESNIEECSPETLEDYPSVSRLLDSFVCLEPQSYIMNLPQQYIETDTSQCSELGKYTYVCMGYVVTGYGTPLWGHWNFDVLTLSVVHLHMTGFAKIYSVLPTI